MNENEKEKKSIVPKISNFISRSIIYPSFKGAKSINKRSNLSNDTRLKGVERNNERVNRRFNVAGGGEGREEARAKQEKKINGRRQKEEKCVTLYARQAFREKG